MWKALRDLFQNNSDYGKLALKENIKTIKMEKGNTIPKYSTRFTQCWDELGSVIVIVSKYDMVILEPQFLPKSWHNY